METAGVTTAAEGAVDEAAAAGREVVVEDLLRVRSAPRVPVADAPPLEPPLRSEPVRSATLGALPVFAVVAALELPAAVLKPSRGEELLSRPSDASRPSLPSRPSLEPSLFGRSAVLSEEANEASALPEPEESSPEPADPPAEPAEEPSPLAEEPSPLADEPSPFAEEPSPWTELSSPED